MQGYGELWNEKQVAGYLQISVKKLQTDRRLRMGIQFHKIGRAVRYKRQDVEKYIEKTLVTTL